jgi:hypothetical protein
MKILTEIFRIGLIDWFWFNFKIDRGKLLIMSEYQKHGKTEYDFACDMTRYGLLRDLLK